MAKRTRPETIEGTTYCAYCGKVLQSRSENYMDLNLTIGQAPLQYRQEKDLVCDCELAQEELSLYDKLGELYKRPVHDSLIEIKVSIYRNKLLNGDGNYTHKTETYF